MTHTSDDSSADVTPPPAAEPEAEPAEPVGSADVSNDSWRETSDDRRSRSPRRRRRSPRDDEDAQQDSTTHGADTDAEDTPAHAETPTSTPEATQQPEVKPEPSMKPMISPEVMVACSIGILAMRNTFTLESVSKLRQKANKYYNEDVGMCLFGIMLIMSGGNFTTCIALWSACRLGGWTTLMEAWTNMCDQMSEVYKSVQQDDDTYKILGDNQDGEIRIWTLLRIGYKLLKVENADEKKQIYATMTKVLGAVKPAEMRNVFIGFYTMALSVVAILHSDFAREVTIGISIGQAIASNFELAGCKKIKQFLPEDYNKWSSSIFSSVASAAGIILTIIFSEVVSSFYACVLGADIFLKYFEKFVTKRKLVSGFPKKGSLFDIRTLFRALLILYCRNLSVLLVASVVGLTAVAIYQPTTAKYVVKDVNARIDALAEFINEEYVVQYE